MLHPSFCPKILELWWNGDIDAIGYSCCGNWCYVYYDFECRRLYLPGFLKHVQWDWSHVKEPFWYHTSMLLPEIGRVCLDLGTPNMQGEQYWQTLISVFISSFLMRSSYDPAACNYVKVGRHLMFNLSMVFVFVCFSCFYPRGLHKYMIYSCMDIHVLCMYIYILVCLYIHIIF